TQVANGIDSDAIAKGNFIVAQMWLKTLENVVLKYKAIPIPIAVSIGIAIDNKNSGVANTSLSLATNLLYMLVTLLVDISTFYTQNTCGNKGL
ncbi:hypothetical protein, partial [Vibrio parahaemolyticus]|uniref:hypothetical protein n=1 Tax=Vibrio parahaemolyticus TaxID=670 RepID=UPI001170F393